MFNPSREQVRRFFCEAWRKYCERLPMEGAEVTAADLIAEHPEYHTLLTSPEAAIEREFTPEGGQMNPFLHLSLHLAIAEQISIDQPPGVRAIYHALRQRHEVHDAEHRVMECLAEEIWHAQQPGGSFDTPRYLESLRRAAGSHVAH